MLRYVPLLFTQSGRHRISKSPRLNWLYQRLGYRVLHCVGDSHAAMFRHLYLNSYLHRTRILVKTVGGASAMGMANPNSKTQALQIFQRYIAPLPKATPLLFILGKVDCGFVIWYRSAKYGDPVEVQFERSLANYQVFIESVQREGRTNLIIASAPLPTIFDHEARGEIAHARREVTASLAERTQLTRRYNAALRHFCQQRGIAFLDYEAEIYCEELQVIRREFLNKDPLDHHLDPDVIAPVLVNKLNQLGYS